MAKPLKKPADTLYERDFYAWTQEQAARLAARAHNDIDWDNVSEEIDSVGRSQKHEIRSRMKVLLQHLLKWEFQPRGRSNSWQSSISEQRTHISGILSDSPSLGSFPAEVLDWAYTRAVQSASQETRISPSIFPETSPYSIDQTLDPAFFPGEQWTPDALVRD
jgi:hypothetical protein